MLSIAPDISIVVPVFNRVELLREAIASVQKQSFNRWELLLCDDGSEISCRKAMRTLADKDPRIRVLGGENRKQGANPCRNRGLHSARAELVLFLDSDDMLLPHCLQQRFSAFSSFQHQPSLAVAAPVLTGATVDQTTLFSRQTSESELIRFLYWDLPWQTSGILWQKDFLISIGGWNENWQFFQDWELGLRACLNGLHVSWVEEPDCFFRLHLGTRISQTKRGATDTAWLAKAMETIVSDIVASDTSRSKPLREALASTVFRTFCHLCFWRNRRLAGTFYRKMKLLLGPSLPPTFFADLNSFFLGIPKVRFIDLRLLKVFLRPSLTRWFD